ncbi:MAG: phosphoribosylamine--glycine ligase [Bryobacteraceae bacterium]|nr:phosphoribosylamine--glycine ligase [Bryobacteraceae bacterium]
MKILVLGSGGREHAIAWRLRQSPSVSRVFVAPGNPGCAQVAECIPVSNPTPVGFLEAARQCGADLVLSGPEAPLVDGAADLFAKEGIPFFGPTQAAARLEGSKIFAKQFMQRAGIPTARFAAANSLDEARAALDEFTYPVVVKADGLAAGKGVVICPSRPEAEQILEEMFAGRLVGGAGSRVVLEEYLTGEEVSFIGVSDGERIVSLEPSQDHKRIFDNDEGPNTGGMGAYSDSRILNGQQRAFIEREIMQRTIDRMREEGAPFRGFLYAGLMMTGRGPMVLEYNVRLGDPETQALLHRMEGDFGVLVRSAAEGRVDSSALRFRAQPSVCVVLAAAGYPGTPRTGDPITGIEEAERRGATVFHAGTRLDGGRLVTAGGRVLGVTHSGETLAEAIDNAYRACEAIRFEGMQFRRDIGRKGLARWRQ